MLCFGKRIGVLYVDLCAVIVQYQHLTALMLAAANGHSEVTSLLLTSGAQSEAGDKVLKKERNNHSSIFFNILHLLLIKSNIDIIFIDIVNMLFFYNYFLVFLFIDVVFEVFCYIFLCLFC